MGIAFAYVYVAAPAWLAVPSRKACLSSVQDKRSRATLKSAVVVLPMFSCHVPMLSALAYTNGACARTPKGVSKKGNSSRAEHSTAQASGAESRRRRAASEPFQERCLHNANTAAFAAALSRPGTASMFPTSRSEVTPATDCSLHGFMCFATTHCLRRRPRSALPELGKPILRLATWLACSTTQPPPERSTDLVEASARPASSSCTNVLPRQLSVWSRCRKSIRSSCIKR
jgi:hypothetical protein